MATTTRATPTKMKNNGSSSALNGVLDGAEALVAATADMGEEKLESLRSTLQGELEAARKQLERLEGKLVERANGIDDYVHENPWQAIGVAGAIGVLVGAVAFRR